MKSNETRSRVIEQQQDREESNAFPAFLTGRLWHSVLDRIMEKAIEKFERVDEQMIRI